MVNHRPFLTIPLLVISLFASALTAEEKAQLPVVATVAEALTLAKENDRLLLVEILQTGCSHCELFQEKVLASKTFQEYAAKHLYIVFYDIKKRSDLTAFQASEMTNLIKDHHVQFTPTILVFASNGEKLLRTQGYKGTSTEAIIASLQSLSNS